MGPDSSQVPAGADGARPRRSQSSKSNPSASASVTRETSATVNFPTAYDVLWNVYITPKGSGVISLNDIPRFSVTSQSTSSFTVRFFTGENSTFEGWDISGAVSFGWVAYGTKEVP